MNCYQKGFTIIELLTVMVIMGLVIGGVIAIYTMSATVWKEGSVQVVLQRGGSIAMEKMVRGVYGTDGIREASNVALSVSNTKIEYTNTSEVGGPERSFYLSGSEIMYDPNTDPLVLNDEFSIAENVTGVEFSVSGNIVTIDLIMEGQVIDRKINVDLSTQVKLRN